MTLPFYPFYWGDYSKKTFDLTQGQHGAYILLLRYCYTENIGKIPSKAVYSISKASLPEERENTDVVIAQFFTKKGDFYHNSKVDEVKPKWENKHEAHVRAGKKAKKTGLPGSGSPDEAPNEPGRSNQNLNQSKIKNKKIVRATTPSTAEGGQVAVFEGTPAWDAWRKHRGKSIPTTDIRLPGHQIRKGWYFPTEFPPAKPEAKS